MTILSRKLTSAHTPSTTNILDKYGIAKGELIRGVICPKCSVMSMIRKYGTWQCKKCNQTSVDAHLAAFNDYKLLISDYITNQEARDFLRITSPNVVRGLFKHASFKFAGDTKGRFYELEYR